MTTSTNDDNNNAGGEQQQQFGLPPQGPPPSGSGGSPDNRQAPRLGTFARTVLNLRAVNNSGGSSSRLLFHNTNNNDTNPNNNDNDSSSDDDDDDDDDKNNDKRRSSVLLFSDEPLTPPTQLFAGYQSNTNRFLRAATTLQTMNKLNKSISSSRVVDTNNTGGGEHHHHHHHHHDHHHDHTAPKDNIDAASVRSSSNGSEVLQGRLDEINIYELIKDGPTNNLHLTVRGLHKHVLWCITQPMTVTDVSALRKSKYYGVDEQQQQQQQATGTTTSNNTNLKRDEEEIIFTQSNDSTGGPTTVTAGGAATPTPATTKSIIASKRSTSNLSNEEKEKKTRFAELQSTMQQEDALLAANSISRQSSHEFTRETSDPDGVLKGLIDPNSNQQSQQLQQHVATTAKERLGGYLHPRDMRRLVSPFSASNEPDLIVRRHVMLLNFDPLRAIILRDRLLIIVPNGAEILYEALERRIRGGSNAIMNSILGHATSFDVSSSNHPPNAKTTTTTPIVNGIAAVSASPPIAAVGPPESNEPTATALPSLPQPTKPSSSTFIKSLVQAAKASSASMNDDSTKGRTTSSSGSNILDSSNSLKGGTVDTVSMRSDDPDLYDDGGEWDDIHNTTNIDLPFELLCVDSVLHIVARILTDDTYQLQSKIYEYMQEEGIMQSEQYHHNNGKQKQTKKKKKKHHHGKSKQAKLDPLSMIRLQKDAVSEMSNRVNRFIQSMNRILDRDEDMALMNLSRLITHPERFVKPVDVTVITEELDEPQLILEAHIQVGLTLDNALTLLQGQLTTSNDLIGQKLTALTNRLLFANTLISVFSLCVGVGSFVGSIFGMNVTNHIENVDSAFIIITVVTILFSITLGGFIMLVFIWTGTVPTAGLMDRV